MLKEPSQHRRLAGQCDGYGRLPCHQRHRDLEGYVGVSRYLGFRGPGPLSRGRHTPAVVVRLLTSIAPFTGRALKVLDIDGVAGAGPVKGRVVAAFASRNAEFHRLTHQVRHGHAAVAVVVAGQGTGLHVHLHQTPLFTRPDGPIVGTAVVTTAKGTNLNCRIES